MHPIHKEKYILSKDTYGHFTVDQNKQKIEAKKRGIKLTAWVQIIVGVLFIASVIILKQTNMFVFTVFAVIMIIVGIHGLKKKYPDYDKQIWKNIETSWQGKGYDQCWFDVKFYEDHLKYLAGENIDELNYTDYIGCFENEHYFGIHFVTGDLILFNPDCNREKIKEIITSYRKKGLEEEIKEKAEEAVTNEIIEDMTEEIAEEILE
ncbi:MAG: hypothetical protein IJN69_06620 [Oscillospiraceae bacterium]|nr:hypothetical protein [Oscillospiraceae bacterium]